MRYARDPKASNQEVIDRMAEAKRLGPTRAPKLFVFLDADPPEKPANEGWYAIQWFENGKWNRRNVKNRPWKLNVPWVDRADNEAVEIAYRLGRLVHSRQTPRGSRGRDITSRDTRKKARNVWRQFAQGFAARPRPKEKPARKAAVRKGPALTERQQLGQKAFLRKQHAAYRARMASEEGAFEPIGGRTHLEHLGAREEYRQAPWYKRFAKKQARRVSKWAERDKTSASLKVPLRRDARWGTERDPDKHARHINDLLAGKTIPYPPQGAWIGGRHPSSSEWAAELDDKLRARHQHVLVTGADGWYAVPISRTGRDVTRDWPGQPIRHKRAAKLGWRRRKRRAGLERRAGLKHGHVRGEISLPGRGWRKMTPKEMREALKEVREMDRLMTLHGKSFPKRRKSRKRARRDRW